MAENTHPESLVSTQWVTEHLDDPTVRFVEVVWGESPDWGTPAYQAGHIPGAVAWDFGADLHAAAGDEIVDIAGFETLLGCSGITPSTTIVVYSGLTNLLATFAFWLLKVYDHADVRLLDGDRRKWLEEGRPIATDSPVFATTQYNIEQPKFYLRAGVEDILQSLVQPGYLLVDARTPEMFNGDDTAGTTRGGHIPGAVNYPATRLSNPDGSFGSWRTPSLRNDGTFRSVDELRAIMTSIGILSDRQITTYCVRGGLSTHAWFVLTQLLGYPNVSEYDRSWAEWGNLTHLPING